MINPIALLHQDMSRIMSGDLTTCYFCRKPHSKETNCHPMDLIDTVRDLKAENERLKGTIDHLNQELNARKGG